ncbi:MAG: four helix bundle protein [Anaerolineales bacterium]
MPKGIEGLEIWQRSVSFVERIYKEVLPLLPAEEKWAMTNQLRRASQSVPANIAEGYGRFYFQEGVRFCYIARGSLEEVYSHLVLARKLGYISEELSKSLIVEMELLRKLINGYMAFLKRSKQGENEPGSQYQVSESRAEYDFGSDANDVPN